MSGNDDARESHPRAINLVVGKLELMVRMVVSMTPYGWQGCMSRQLISTSSRILSYGAVPTKLQDLGYGLCLWSEFGASM